MSVYISLTGRRIYHRRNCKCIDHLSDDEVVSDSQHHLLRIGFKPCKRCMKGLEEKYLSEEEILKDFAVQYDIRYRIQGGTILINTDVGFWKLTRGPEFYYIYHGNSFPVNYYPSNDKVSENEYHRQTDVKLETLKDLTKTVNYIVEHDKFRLGQILSSNKLPKKTKKQRSYYNEMKRKRNAYEHCRVLQMMDKVNRPRNGGK